MTKKIYTVSESGQENASKTTLDDDKKTTTENGILSESNKETTIENEKVSESNEETNTENEIALESNEETNTEDGIVSESNEETNTEDGISSESNKETNTEDVKVSESNEETNTEDIIVSESSEETKTENNIVSERNVETSTENEIVSEINEKTSTENESNKETITETGIILESHEETDAETRVVSEGNEETSTENDIFPEKTDKTNTENKIVSDINEETNTENESEINQETITENRKESIILPDANIENATFIVTDDDQGYATLLNVTEKRIISQDEHGNVTELVMTYRINQTNIREGETGFDQLVVTENSIVTKIIQVTEIIKGDQGNSAEEANGDSGTLNSDFDNYFDKTKTFVQTKNVDSHDVSEDNYDVSDSETETNFGYYDDEGSGSNEENDSYDSYDSYDDEGSGSNDDFDKNEDKPSDEDNETVSEGPNGFETTDLGPGEEVIEPAEHDSFAPTKFVLQESDVGNDYADANDYLQYILEGVSTTTTDTSNDEYDEMAGI